MAMYPRESVVAANVAPQPLAPDSSSAAMRAGLNSGSPMTSLGSSSLDDLYRRRRGGGMGGAMGGGAFGSSRAMGDAGLAGLLAAAPLSLDSSPSAFFSFGAPESVAGMIPNMNSAPDSVGSGTGFVSQPEPLAPGDPGYVAPTPPTSPATNPTPTPLVQGVVSPSSPKGPTTFAAPTPLPATNSGVRPGVATTFNTASLSPSSVGLTSPTMTSPTGTPLSLRNGGRARKRAPVTIDQPVRRYAKGGRAFSFAPTYQDYLMQHADPGVYGGSEGGQGTFAGFTQSQWDAMSPQAQWSALGNGLAVARNDPRYADLASQLGMTNGRAIRLGYADRMGPIDPKYIVDPNRVLMGDNVSATPDDNLTPLAQFAGGGLSDKGWALAALSVLGGGAALGGALGGAGAAAGGSSALQTGGILSGADVGAGTSGLGYVGGAASDVGLGTSAASGADGNYWDMQASNAGSTDVPVGEEPYAGGEGLPDDPGFAAQGGDYGTPVNNALPTGSDFPGFNPDNPLNISPPDVSVPPPDIPGYTGLGTNLLSAGRGIAGLAGLVGGRRPSSAGQVPNVGAPGNGAPGAVNAGAVGTPSAGPGGTAVDPSLYSFDPNDYVASASTGNWQAARANFQPIESALFADALKAGSDSEQEAAAGRAAADAAHQAELNRTAARDRLIAQGFNPDDARGPGMEISRLANLDSTKASVGAQNAARLAEKNRGTALKAQATQIGQADAAQGLSADNMATSASIANANRRAGLRQTSMQLGTNLANSALDRQYRYADLGERSTNDMNRNEITRSLANNTIATGNSQRNASDRAATGAGISAIIDGAQGIYNLGGSLGFWKNGGRVKRLNDVGLRYANGGSVVPYSTMPFSMNPRGAASFAPPGRMLGAEQGNFASPGAMYAVDAAGARGGDLDGGMHHSLDANPGTGIDPWANSRALASGSASGVAPYGSMIASGTAPYGSMQASGADASAPYGSMQSGDSAPGTAPYGSMQASGPGESIAPYGSMLAGDRPSASGSFAPYGSMSTGNPIAPYGSMAAASAGLSSMAAGHAGSGIAANVGPYPLSPMARTPRPGIGPRPMAFKKGGRVSKRVKSYQSGGPVSGPGTATSDSIRARLSDGEHVVNAEGTQLADSMYPGMLEGLNRKGLAIRQAREELMRRISDIGLGD